MNRYSSVPLHVNPKVPSSREKLKITSAKVKNFIKKNFMSNLVKKNCSKEMWVLIMKRLKHLNTVVYSILKKKFHM